MRLPVVGVVSIEDGNGMGHVGVSATVTYAHGTGLRDAGCFLFGSRVLRMRREDTQSTAMKL